MSILLQTVMFVRENEKQIGARRRLCDGVFSVYLRVGWKTQFPGKTFLHIPDVGILKGHRDRGLFTAYLDALELIRPLDGISVQGVVNMRLWPYLERRGYINDGVADFTIVW
jgi:hypothetical protein